MNNIDYLIEELIKEDKRLSDIKIPSTLDEKKDLYRAIRNIREPKYISKEYLNLQDKYLQEEIKLKGIIDEKDIPKDKGIISIWFGDITTLKVDVIVNACNKYLLGCFNPTHRCIDNTIHSFAGMQLREECNNIMKGKTLPNGEVVITSAYNLPSKYIIHTVGPQINKIPTPKDEKDLANCYFNALELAKAKGLKTIAFPCIATGLYGFPQDKASKIAIKTINDYLSTNKNIFNHIIFNVFKDEDLILYKKLYNLVKNKNYFVITTNTDGQFINNGFAKEKVFEVQGSYSKLQCSIPCHNKLYDNEKLIKEMLINIDKDLKIPTSLVPKCPVCGAKMEVNLRCDDTFVEDDNWQLLQNRYNDFIENNLDKKVLLLEFGVGFNTPSIIRFPFERMTYIHDNFKLIRFNNKYYNLPKEIKNKSISVSDNINEVLDLIQKL